MRAILITLAAGLVFIGAVLLLTRPDDPTPRAVSPPTPGGQPRTAAAPAPMDPSDAAGPSSPVQARPEPATETAAAALGEDEPDAGGQLPPRRGEPRVFARSGGPTEAEMRAMRPPRSGESTEPRRELTPTERFERDQAQAILAVEAGLADETVLERRVDNAAPNGTPEEREIARTQILAAMWRYHEAALRKVGPNSTFSNLQHAEGMGGIADTSAR